MNVTDEMVEAACVAQDGPTWRSFNASLEWPVRAGLEAALAVADGPSSEVDADEVTRRAAQAATGQQKPEQH